MLIMKDYFILSTVVLRNLTQKKVCKKILSLLDLSFILVKIKNSLFLPSLGRGASEMRSLLRQTT